MVINMMRRVYLVSNLYLGDAFVINALVRNIAQTSDELWLPTLPQYVETVSCLYQDLPQVKVVPYVDHQHERELIQQHQLAEINFRTIFEITRMPIKGWSQSVEVPVHWDRQIYEYFDVPFSRRYKDTVLPTCTPGAHMLCHKLNPENQPFALWHRLAAQASLPAQIDLAAWRIAAGLPPLKIIEVEPGHTSNFLDWMGLIKQADEIHVIPSSLHCLTDSMATQIKADLFYHDVKAHTVMQPNCRWNMWRWNQVHYEHKFL
jgi:hypothetical protein